MARILPPTPESIRIAANALIQNDVVGMPTETVYGLAGNAFSPPSLARIFATKERPSFDPLIVHVAPPPSPNPISLQDLQTQGLIRIQALSANAQRKASRLIEAFWPGPLTLVLAKDPRVPDLATSGLDTVAIRMPQHPVAQALIQAAGTPLAAPSANRFGRISPTSAADVEEELGDRISWILDGGTSSIGLESTVVRVTVEGEVLLLRPGQISREAIEIVIESRLTQFNSTAVSGPSQLHAPGMLASHYAPRKPLLVLPRPLTSLGREEFLAWWGAVRTRHQPTQIAILLMAGPSLVTPSMLSEWTGQAFEGWSLSERGDWNEAAQNFFAALRAMDRSNADLLIAEPCLENQGIAYAIRDRLQRASAKRD